MVFGGKIFSYSSFPPSNYPTSPSPTLLPFVALTTLLPHPRSCGSSYQMSLLRILELGGLELLNPGFLGRLIY